MIRIDAPKWTQNDTVVDGRQHLWLGNATLRDDLHVLGRNAVASVDGTARRQRVLYLVTELQGVGVADEVAEVEEHFLVVLECFDEAKVFLGGYSFLSTIVTQQIGNPTYLQHSDETMVNLARLNVSIGIAGLHHGRRTVHTVAVVHSGAR